MDTPAIVHSLTKPGIECGHAEMTDHPREVIEAAIAHVVQNKVDAVYARSDLFEWRCYRRS